MNACNGYLVNEHVVEVVGEAASKGVSQLSEEKLLLLHSHQLFVAYVWSVTTATASIQRTSKKRRKHVGCTDLVGGPHSCTAGGLQRH